EIATDLAGASNMERAARARLDILLLKYNELGFESSATRKGGKITLEHRNCPFLAAAKGDSGAMCHHLDKGILKAAYPGATTELVATMAEGAASCQFVIRGPAASPANG